VPADQPPQSGGLRAKLRGLVREVGKFGVVSGTAFAVDLVIFNVLLQMGSETLLAKTCSTAMATTLAFLGNRFWTWRDRGHHHMARQYTTFFLLNAVGLGIGLACLGAAACFLLPAYYVNPQVGSGFVLVAFTIVVLGGMGIFGGALLGGLLIGVVESIGGLLLGDSLGQVGIYLIFIAVLLLRPQGLFGDRA